MTVFIASQITAFKMYLISERNSLQIMAFFCIESRLQYQTNEFEWWLLTDFFPRNKDFSTSWPTSDEWRVKLSDDYYHLGFRIWLLWRVYLLQYVQPSVNLCIYMVQYFSFIFWYWPSIDHQRTLSYKVVDMDKSQILKPRW
jgi:hypothetical protein